MGHGYKIIDVLNTATQGLAISMLNNITIVLDKHGHYWKMALDCCLDFEYLFLWI